MAAAGPFAFRETAMAREAIDFVPADGTEAAAMGKAGRKWVRWTKALKTDFLDHLAASCDVKASARQIGVDPASVYALRRKDPGFAEGWSAALALGYELLETQLIGHALAGGGPTIDNGRDPIDCDLALRLLAAHRDHDRAGPARRRRGGPPLKRLSREELEAVLLKKLEAVERTLPDRP
ncbi:hypothetical protein [Sphingomonas sp. DT-204]|uniref:hypothetical protein n=1 Tax=Sphingomonas sp. DT-204 TaxID=3396166 RepID=UPI003F1A1917